jgi:hypothetical protein
MRPNAHIWDILCAACHLTQLFIGLAIPTVAQASPD